MDSLGEYFKKHREVKNISLEEVSKFTKISKKVLAAIENDQYENLPPAVIVRGFVQSYARFLELDEQEALNLYDALHPSTPVILTPPREVYPSRIPRNSLVLLGIAILAVILIGGLSLFLRSHPDQSVHPALPSRPAKAIPKSPAPPSIPKPVPEKTTLSGTITATQPETAPLKTQAGPAEPAPSAPIPIKMAIKCQSTTWIGYKIDDRPFAQVTLAPGEEVVWTGNERIELKLGNAGGISITLNGRPLKPLGKKGEVLDAVVTGSTVTIDDEEPEALQTWTETEDEDEE